MVYDKPSMKGIIMITIVNTPFGYYIYSIDNLWTGLSQMGDVNVNLETN